MLAQSSPQASAETKTVRTERALVACAAQLVAENQAQQAGRAHEQSTKADDDPEKAQLRKELTLISRRRGMTTSKEQVIGPGLHGGDFLVS